MSHCKKLAIEVINHLQKGTDSREGFGAKIDNLLRAIESLEEWNVHVEKENAELRDQLALSVPRLCFDYEVDEEELLNKDIFEWRMEAIRWRCILPRGALKWKPDQIARMKRRAFRDLFLQVKKDFLRNWEFNKLWWLR